MKHPVSISQSKTKLIALIACFISLSLFGGFMMTLRTEDAAFIHPLGLTCMVISGAVALRLASKFFDETPRLEFRDEGLFENTNIFSFGLIYWEDISGIEVWQHKGNKALYITLLDPEKYISRHKPLKRALMRFTLKIGGGGTVGISANLLKISFAELLSLVEQNLSERSKT